MAVRQGLGGDWYDFTGNGFVGACVLAILSVAGAVVFLEGRPSLFRVARETSRRVSGAPSGDGANPITLERLKRLMETDEAWRREGLTIGEVAEAVGVPEYRLRRLINDHLGHRNFADFLNAYRIASAKTRLSEPELARTTVATIAFDVGYGSLGPFNRAFKAYTGATPTEWRRRMLEPVSPDLEKAR
jgi:AraC-like DNA-binding protein